MELLSPAGNIEKLYYAFAYGADAVYIGLKQFSLRIKADNFYDDEYQKVIAIKNKFKNKRIYCALNIAFHNEDILSFKNNIDYFKQYPIDAFIIQDIGLIPTLQKEFPNAQLHLSTQASCINSDAVKFYKQLGFKRIVLGREASLDEIKQIKDDVPDMELEAFCHGAMCIAYSGRCLMSSYLTGRSAQSGFCSHTCRWNFNLSADAKQLAQSGALLLEEEKRPNEYFPIFEGENFTAMLSSKDINMINNLADMKKAGLDCLKIEGRMKSIYYVALVTRAYRKAIDALEGKITSEEALPFIAELDNVSHRESTTGFYYSREDADKTTSGASESPYLLVAEIGKEITLEEQNKIFELGKSTVEQFNSELNSLCKEARRARDIDLEKHPEKRPICLQKKDGWKLYNFKALNKTDISQTLEIITPENALQIIESKNWQLVDLENGTLREWTFDGHPSAIYLPLQIEEGALVRTKDLTFSEDRIKAASR